MIETNHEEYSRFKKLLEYFVAHLEWLVNADEHAKEYKKYIQPLIEKGGFTKAGQGYKDGQIQQQIETWDKYELGQICINIQSNFGDYKSSKCYLNWKGTGLNILAVWNKNNITALRQEEYLFWEDNPSRKDLRMKKELNILQLFDGFDLPNNDLTEFYQSFKQAIIIYNEREKKIIQMENTNLYTELLRYKKQIILQGPPGTGKTRLAKQLARTLIYGNNEMDINMFHNRIIDGLEFKLNDMVSPIKVESVRDNFIYIKRNNGETFSFTMGDLYNVYKSGAWLNNEFLDYPLYAQRCLVRFIVAQIQEIGEKNLKIIQFHPSYAYEDFVRGIVAKPNPDGEGIIYEAENKILAQFAKQALDNYKDSLSTTITGVAVEEQAKSNMDRFITHVIDTIDKDKKYHISDNVYIFYVDNKRFKYKGDNWDTHPKGLNMNFSELEKIIAARISDRADIVKLHSLNALTRSHATYYANVVEKYNAFLSESSSSYDTASIQLQNYVLIIDEINRANLSSVLGELIYALEYRGEEVDSMYEVNGSNKLVLPPNLYIIGTMNTADRSVGHIDYAIRRRFAFVNIEPQELQDDEEIYFNNHGYNKVARLFDKNVSSEFDANDVKIGHSYFITKKKEVTIEAKDELFRLKMNYEIIPILNDYVKDGILVGEIDKKSIKDYIEELRSKS